MFDIFKKLKKQPTQEAGWPYHAELADEDFALNAEQTEAFEKIPTDDEGFMRLGDLTRNVLGEQVQYISEHFSGSREGVPVLTEDLIVDASGTGYHSYRIHKGDAKVFIARLRVYRRSIGRPCR